jgi:hypothetical protein
MSKIEISSNQRVIDHSYNLNPDVVEHIIWFDDETGEFAYVAFNTSKNEYVEILARLSPGLLSVGGKLK